MTQFTDYDWSEIVAKLRALGMTTTDIMRESRSAVAESMIRQYQAGATPSHWRGELLLDIWERKTGLDRCVAPRRPADLRRVAVGMFPTKKPQNSA